MNIGKYQLSAIVTENFALDGGAMFGSVPKTLWSKTIVPDEKNRIPMACRVLIVRTGERTVLVDVGCGSKWSAKERDIYAIEPQLSKPLAEQVPGVTDIVLTHLHFDHAGGISERGEDGELRLTFPRARVYCSRRNYDHARSPGIRERASYLADNIAILEQADLVLTDDGDEVLPGLSLHQSHGHTHGLQWVKVSAGGATAVFPSDLMPTAHHVPLPWVMGYDLCAETTMREKEQFLAAAAEEEWAVVFEHDRDTAAGIVGRDERGRYQLKSKISFT